jgi:general secretion pathway protein G
MQMKTGGRMSHVRHSRGFTLIEIILVVMIIGVLAAMVVPRLSGRSEQARVSVAVADIEVSFATALKLYEIDNGTFPSTEEGLDALMAAPASAVRWKGPYLDRKILDPWGQEYQYRFPGLRGSAYDIFSLGADGMQSSDDVTSESPEAKS